MHTYTIIIILCLNIHFIFNLIIADKSVVKYVLLNIAHIVRQEDITIFVSATFTA